MEMNLLNNLILIVYLVSSILFIFGIKMLSAVKTARKGNLLSAIGMFLAIIVTLLNKEIISYELILSGIIIGTFIGILMAIKVPMTGMPQMVGVLNGFGGIASTFVAISEFYKLQHHSELENTVVLITIALSIIIGTITFSGSFIAFGKLQGIVTGKVVKYKFQHQINLILLLALIILSILFVNNPTRNELITIVTLLSLILGILLTLPIGGADMPVAISLLNSYSGLAASATGFVINNYMLIIAGSLVGASGIILTNIMCKAMNRSLLNVAMGGLDNAGSTTSTTTTQNITIKSVDSDEAAMIFDAAQKVIIVPGYGMAVSQAQMAVRDLFLTLEKKGIDVKFAIHPVAGRMPGHMNVLLAEANIPYEKLYAMEDINDEFSNTDVVFVVGANDVVNPAARNNPQSPIYGMPILNVDYAKTVIVNKRSMNPGYAGIDNELFGYPNTLMYFGDAKEAITKLNNAIKEL
ncbi:MAG TPA: NAD(P)(+) transhydrogenase (Re/Si-specific) subunit beta [Ignavibacteriales bacterium]|nr:NAD(P)(+) transhydrogenase (Re/Si-specific) subunit beta [Ignavibacteriales bacterium]HOL81734.1 NAD(P)(+) transhydrogenase (Re/Si-specific) subunit beta [Ignavibacteriales bacterium]HPP32928.1 NAD(P)(+) transhydrogenase (Re/Si-specific) subunit beta [Ignavibacteriales bacterium]HRT99746.1 NAD(P)(+) transhydrogenase (Re/Si-specific) subunit beta [Ignavibacteriales bacterium]